MINVNLSLLCICCVLTACSNSVNTVERAVPTATPTRVVDQRIITDRSLANKLQVVSIDQAFVSEDILKVQATVTNTKKSSESFVYAFEFIDSDGMALRSPGGGWRPITLLGGETKSISAVATSPKAADFRLKFQER